MSDRQREISESVAPRCETCQPSDLGVDPLWLEDFAVRLHDVTNRALLRSGMVTSLAERLIATWLRHKVDQLERVKP